MTSRGRAYGPLYPVLIVLSGLCSLAAVLTLIPNPGASWPNILDYKSLCTFAPAASFACALAAGLVCTLRARLIRRRPGPLFVPIFVLGVLAAGLIWSGIIWAGAKAKYATQAATDATSAASQSEP